MKAVFISLYSPLENTHSRKLKYNAALERSLFVQANLDEFEHFCETIMMAQLWIQFQSARARPILSCFSEDTVYPQRVKTEALWPGETICQEIKEIKNGRELPFLALSFSGSHRSKSHVSY